LTKLRGVGEGQGHERRGRKNPGEPHTGTAGPDKALGSRTELLAAGIAIAILAVAMVAAFRPAASSSSSSSTTSTSVYLGYPETTTTIFPYGSTSFTYNSSGIVPPTIQISGYATAGNLGNVTGVVFMLQSHVNGYIGPVGFLSTQVPNGQYTVTVPNDADYAVAIDFQPPNNGPAGTCGVGNVIVNQPAGNSSLTYNWSCPPG